MTRAALLIALLLAAPPATSQTACGDRAGIVAGLESRFGERPAGVGLASSGAVVELWRVPETNPSGAWTLLTTRPGGLSCVIAVGEAWHTVTPPPKGDPL